jgi:2-oxoglutarate ferredoxin oxidoreductase subunit delta
MSGRTFEIVVLEGFCKGCGLCVEFCEQGKLYVQQKPNKEGIQTAAVRAEVRCSGCRKCAIICPDAAIEISRIEALAASDEAHGPVGQ